MRIQKEKQTPGATNDLQNPINDSVHTEMCAWWWRETETEKEREIQRRKETRASSIPLYDEQVDYCADLIDGLKRA